MNDDEIISHQARTIIELTEQLKDLKERIRQAHLHIICIGGPLNDNKLGYSKEQLVTFHRIEQELNLD